MADLRRQLRELAELAHATNGGPYHLVAAPATPVRADALPAEIADVATRLRCVLCFEDERAITDDILIGI